MAIMCGRFTLTQSDQIIAQAFHLKDVPDVVPRYNIAPSQAVATVLLPGSESKEPRCHYLQWGLVPSWAKDPKIGFSLINARAETLAEKPSFRAAFKRRRCLILADGFYEWQRQEKRKQPFYFGLSDHAPFAFAGLWEHWESGDGSVIDSCTIITTEANALLQPIHDRMPVILKAADYDQWLDPAEQKTDRLQRLLHPFAAEAMMAYPVSTQVNNFRYDDADCIRPLEQHG